MLDKNNRLKKRKSFAYIFKNGKTVTTTHFAITYHSANGKYPRIGFSVSKIVGKAYARNKVKRRLRAVVRENINSFTKNYNYIVRAKAGSYELGFDELYSEIVTLIARVSSAIAEQK